MKNTVAMVLWLLVTWAVWFLVAAIVAIATTGPYREALGSFPVFMIMITVGWFPGTVVADDYEKL